MRWRRKAAENGDSKACFTLAVRLYGDQPYAREVGHVGEAARVATSAEVIEGHDVPPDVLTGVVKRWRGVTIATSTLGARLWAK